MSQGSPGTRTATGTPDIGIMDPIPILVIIPAHVRTVLLHNRILIRGPETKRIREEGGDRHQGPAHPATTPADRKPAAAEVQCVSQATGLDRNTSLEQGRNYGMGMEKQDIDFNGKSLKSWSRRQESNLYLALRRHSFYPLNYGETRGMLTR